MNDARVGTKHKKKFKPHENRNLAERLLKERRGKRREYRQSRDKIYHFPHNHNSNPRKKKRDADKVTKRRQIAKASRKRNRR